MSNSLDLPVVLIVFNRPHITTLAMDRLRAIRPKTLLVVADGHGALDRMNPGCAPR